MTNNLGNQIKELKTYYSRDNYYYMRRRIDKGNGKKTLGWIMENANMNKTLKHKDFNQLHEHMEKKING